MVRLVSGFAQQGTLALVDPAFIRAAYPLAGGERDVTDDS